MNGDAKCVRIVHSTTYRFALARRSCEIAARLEPQSFGGQTTLATQISVTPAPAGHARERDGWNNAVDRFNLEGPLTEICVTSDSLVEMHGGSGSGGERLRPQLFSAEAPTDACRRNGALWRWAAQCLPDAEPSPPHIVALCNLIRRDFAYDPSATAASRPIPEIFAACRGVCQDFTSLAIAVLRARGLTCRFNTGYLLQGVSETHRAIACHAWFSVWFAERGWIDFDSLAPKAPRALLAAGASQADIPPVAGSCAGSAGRQSIQVEIAVSLASPEHRASRERFPQQATELFACEFSRDP